MSAIDELFAGTGYWVYPQREAVRFEEFKDPEEAMRAAGLEE